MASGQAPISLGSRFRTIQSQAPSIAFSSGNTASVELPRSFPYKMIRARLRGSLTIGTGTTPLSDSPVGLIRRFTVIADGRKQLIDISGQHAYRLSNLLNGKAGELVPASATGNFFGAFNVHHEMRRFLSPIWSYFDPRPYEKVEARVQWGTTSDLLGTPGTATIGAETALDLQLVQTSAGEDAMGFNKIISFDEFSFGAAPVSNFTINVPRTGLLAGILISTYQAGVATNDFFQNTATGSSNVAGGLTLKSDNNFVHIDNLNPSTIQAANVEDYQLDSNTGGTNMGQGITGYYYLDLTEDGMATSLLNTYDLNVLQLLVSSRAGLATATTLRVTYTFFEPISAA